MRKPARRCCAFLLSASLTVLLSASPTCAFHGLGGGHLTARHGGARSTAAVGGAVMMADLGGSSSGGSGLSSGAGSGGAPKKKKKKKKKRLRHTDGTLPEELLHVPRSQMARHTRAAFLPPPFALSCEPRSQRARHPRTAGFRVLIPSCGGVSTVDPRAA